MIPCNEKLYKKHLSNKQDTHFDKSYLFLCWGN
jgi:hypothetical protein